MVKLFFKLSSWSVGVPASLVVVAGLFAGTALATAAPASSGPTGASGTGTIKGKILDGASASSAPLAGACATAANGSGTIFQQAGPTTSTGLFKITGLPPDQYEVFAFDCASPASPNDYVPVVFKNHPGLDADMTDPVTVTAGATTSGINFKLPVGGAIQIHAQNSDGSPVTSGFACPLFPTIDSQDNFCYSLDGSGNVTIVGVPVGPNRFSVVNQSTGQRIFYTPSAGGTTVFWQSTKVTIVAMQTAPTITFTFPPPSSSSATPTAGTGHLVMHRGVVSRR